MAHVMVIQLFKNVNISIMMNNIQNNQQISFTLSNYDHSIHINMNSTQQLIKLNIQ